MGVADFPDQILRKAAEQNAGSTQDYYLKTSDVTGLIRVTYDHVSATYPTASSEVYTFKSGGSGGTTVGVVTIVYTSSTKENILTVDVT